jgi:alkaline phosphatase
MNLSKLFLVLSLLLILNFSFGQETKKYLQGEYNKEVTGQVYTSPHQHKVDQIQAIAHPNAEIRNVILLIGDGMGLAQVFAGFSANNDELYIQYANQTGFQKTKSKNKYKTDSAAAGTALACGTKTNNGAIGVDSDGNLVPSILEIASENGKATGVVVTCAITHATPAAFVAHTGSRKNTADIAKFFVSDKIDVFIGGGLDDFSQRADNDDLIPELQEKGFQVVTKTEELHTINDGKLAALLKPGHLEKYPERGDILPQSTAKAIDILSKDKDGFFLMVEGSQIDWAGHDMDFTYLVEEMLDFDRAVGAALKFAEKDGHTLVIITADHETGGLSIHDANLAEGSVEGRFSTDNHSTIMVPVFAYGPGAELFTGIYENTAIFQKMMESFKFAKEKK